MSPVSARSRKHRENGEEEGQGQDGEETYLRMYIRLSRQGCCRDWDAGSKADDPEYCWPAAAADRQNDPRNRHSGVEAVAEVPGCDAAGVQCSRVSSVVDGEEQDPAVGDGGDAA